MQDLVKAVSLLKTVYRQMLVDMTNSETALDSRFKKFPSEVWEGKDFIEWAIRVGRTQAFGSYRPGAPLPESQHQPTATMKVPLRFHGGRIGIDTPTMKITRSQRGSFKRSWEYEQEMFKVDYIDYRNEMSWQDGRGVIGLASAAASGTTTVSVDTPGGVAGSINGARFFQPNMRVGVLSADGTTLLATRRVVSVSDDGDEVTFNAALSAAQCPDNAIFVRAPSLNVTDINHVSYNTDAMGLIGMIDDGTYVNEYMGLNRTTTPLARSTVIGGVGALNLDVMQQIVDTMRIVGKGVCNEIWCEYGTRRSFLALQVANRTFVSNGGAANFDVGFKGMALDEDPKFGGAQVKCDKDAPYGMMFFWDTRYACNFENTSFEWADEDGAVMSRVDGVDAYEAVAREYFNRCDEKPNASGRLDDIDHNNVVVHVR